MKSEDVVLVAIIALLLVMPDVDLNEFAAADLVEPSLCFLVGAIMGASCRG